MARIERLLQRTVLLASALTIMACEQGTTGLDPEPERFRYLELSHESEVDVAFYEDGTPIPSGSGYSVQMSPAPGATIYGGSQLTRSITVSPTIQQASFGCQNCGSNGLKYADGIQNDPPQSGEGVTWNGLFVLSVDNGSASCSKTLAINHRDDSGDGDDEFFDVTAADQTLRVDLDTSTSSCTIRTGRSGFHAADGTIVEIPLVLKPGAEVPATLPLVELVVQR